MYCHKCGQKVEDNAKFCSYCGTPLTLYETNEGYQPINQTYAQEEDQSSLGFAFLSGLIPFVGLVLYIIWYKDFPKRAKSCLKGLITGVVLYVITIWFLISVVFGILKDAEIDFYDEYYYDFNNVTHVISCDEKMDAMIHQDYRNYLFEREKSQF